jgi:predicted Zn-dependent protease
MKYVLMPAILVIALSACATVNVVRMGDKKYTLYDDERRLQKRADEICEKIDESRFLYNDTQLKEYLAAITQKLLATEGYGQAIKISTKVIHDPSVNALSLCNGRIYVLTGLLAAMDNEAQVATVIAHEISHILKRDSLREFRSRINKTAFYSSITAGLGISGELTAVSSIAGYSRTLEDEADRESFKMIKSAGYDTLESVKAFEIMNEFNNLESPGTQGAFPSHPKTDSRIENFKRLIKENKALSISRLPTDEQTYKNITCKVALGDIPACLNARMYKTADKFLKKLTKNYPENAEVYFYLGELYRKRQDLEAKEKNRDKAKDYIRAIEAYNRALVFNPLYADAFEGKGIVLQKQGKFSEAKSAFRRYLEINPQADDRSYIENLLSSN